MSRFLRLFRIIAVAFLCVFGMHVDAFASRCSLSNKGSFEIQTTNLSAGDTFSFRVGAQGEFSVDWGDGSTTSFTNTITDGNNGHTVTHNQYGNDPVFSHTYSSGGVKNITVTGCATKYRNFQILTWDEGCCDDNCGSNTYCYHYWSFDTDTHQAISFKGNTKIKHITGSLGDVFPTRGGGDLNDSSFASTFEGCSNFDLYDKNGNLNNNLFGPEITHTKKAMFSNTFKGTNVTEIPPDLFRYIYGPACFNIWGNPADGIDEAERLFAGTFESTPVTSIPQNLFAYRRSGEGIRCSGKFMFSRTFANCQGLTAWNSIPQKLFSQIGMNHDRGAPRSHMFHETFAGTNIGDTTLKYAAGYSNGVIDLTKNLFPSGQAAALYQRTFAENTGLSNLNFRVFPDAEPYYNLFDRTFEGTTNLKRAGGCNSSYTDNVFGPLAAGGGWTTDKVFFGTFRNSSIKSVTSSLFGNYKGGGTQAFARTFEGCMNLKNDNPPSSCSDLGTGHSWLPYNVFHKITDSAYGLFLGTFKDSGLTTIPTYSGSSLFATLTGTGANKMFYWTFYNTPVTSVPKDLFRITSVGDNTFYGTFEWCSQIGSGINGKVNANNDPIMKPSSLTVNNIGGDYPSHGYLAFAHMFQGCTGLTKISSNIIRPISGAFSDAMFYRTFAKSGLTSVPSGMFSTDGKAPQKYLFRETFAGCPNLTTIPNNLFANMSGAPADGMFYGTFMEDECDSNGANCQKSCGLNISFDDLGHNFFGLSTGHVTGAPRFAAFKNTFKGCSGLTGQIPADLFYNLSGNPGDPYTKKGKWDDGSYDPNYSQSNAIAGQSLFEGTFQGTGISGTIPGRLFFNVSGAPAPYIFKNTFKDCTSLQNIGSDPRDRVFHLSGAPAASMFEGTFDGCSGISRSLSALWFGYISGTIAEGAYKNTFRGCTGLTGDIPTPTDPNGSMSGQVKKMFGDVTSSASGAFEGTFQGCTGLTGYVPKSVFSGISASAGSNSYVFGNIFNGATNMVTNCLDVGHAASTSSDRCHSFETAAAWGNGDSGIVRCCGDELRSITYNPGSSTAINASTGTSTPEMTYVAEGDTFTALPIGTFENDGYLMSRWDWREGFGYDEPNHALVPQTQYTYDVEVDTVVEPDWEQCTCNYGDDSGVADCEVHTVNETVNSVVTNRCELEVKCKPGWVKPAWKCDGVKCGASCSRGIYDITLDYNGGTPAGGTSYVVGHVSGENTLIGHIFLKYGDGFYPTSADASAGTNKLNNLGGTESAFSTNYMPGPVDNKPYQGFYGAYVAQAQQGTSTRGGVGVTDAEIQIVNRQGGFNSTTFTTSDTTITARYGDPIYTLTFDDAGGYNGSSQIFLRYSSMAASGPFTPHFYENYEDAYSETNEISRVTIPENPGYRFDGYYLPLDNYTASKTGPAFDSSGFVVSSQFVTSATVPGPKRITDDVTLTAEWSAKFLPVCLDHNGATNASSFHDKVWLEYNTDYYSDNGAGYDSVIHSVDVHDGSVIPQKTGYVFNGYLGPEQGAIRDGGTSSTSNFPLVVNAGGKFINKNFTTDEGIKECDCKKDSSNVCPNFITADYSKEVYEITLDDNGGSGGSPSKFYLWYGNDFYSNSTATNQLGEVTIPTRDGYTFNGYYYGNNCDEEVGLGVSEEIEIGACPQIIDSRGRINSRMNTFAQADATITAQWTPNVYEITVNDNCGDTVCLTSGSPTTLYLKYDNGWYRTRAAAEAGTNQIDAMDTIPTRTGYSFEGYRHTSISNRSGSSSGNGGTQSMTITQVTDNQGRFASNTFTTEDTTIDANWVGACNLIALDSNGGTSGNVRKLFKRTGGTAWYMDDTCSVQYTTTEDVIPTKQNYRFRGFFSTLVTPDVEANADTEGLTQYMMTNGALSYDGYNLVVSGPTIIYAAWARECNTIDPGTCTLDVTLGGIVTYTLDCPDGYTEHGEGTYNPYCTAGCYPILLDNQTRGGTTTNSYLYKFGGGTDATKWYRDDECTTEVTSTPAPSKLNATFNGYYYIQISHDEDVESINTRSDGETTTRTQVGTAADPSVLSDEWTVTGPETIYAYYNCNQNYTNSGIDIAGVCANSVYEITLDDNGGDNGNGYVYEKYAEGWSLDPRAAVFNTTTLTSLPTYTDYVFRGYYSAQLAPLTATGNTGTLVIKKDGTLPTSSTLYQDDDTVYAAWARDCVSPVSHGACTLVVADDGAVEYTTTCDAGYSLTSGGGTYNPVCTVNTYTVTYQLNQGNSSVTPSHAGTHPATYTIEDTFTITDPTMTGYTFTGWDVATAPTAWGGGQTSVSGDTNFTVAVGTYGNIVFRATWTANTNTPYTVNHYTKNLNDNNYTLNSTDNLTGTSDASVTLASLTHSITGFNYVEGFVGTTTSHPGTTKPSSGAVTSTTILPDGTRVIDLYYNRAEYTIRFKTGDTVAATQSCTYGATVALTQADTMTTNLPEGFPVVENGWIFYGWANTYNRNVQDYADGANITCNDDITLYAILHRNVTFKYGDSVSATTLTTSTRTQSYYNTDATTAGVDGVETYPLYTQSTYHWAPQGWVLNSGIGTSVSVSQTGATTTTATPAANVDAVYSALYKRTATVVYNGNGNTGGTTPNTTVDQYYNVGASSDAAITANVTLATNGFTRTGYHFVKWAAGDVVGPLVAPGDVYPFQNTAWASSDTYTVYAIWLPDTYNITYTMNGGTPAYTQIEYLQTDGTSYIDTGFVPSADYVHELKFNLASTPSASKYICGTSSTNGRSGNVRVTTAKKIDGIYIGTSGAVSILNASTAVPDSVNTLILDLRNNATSYAYLNNTKISKVISSTITSTESLRLGTSTAGSGGTPIKIYGDTITQNGVVIHNFVPARRNSDDVLGLYDTITGTFKTNAAGSGAFSTGTETDIGPLPSTYTYGIGATVAAGEPTRAHSVFDGWTGTDVSTPTASVTIGTTATGDKAYTANWSCENGYSPNAGGTACVANTNTPYKVCHYTKNLSGSAYTLDGGACENKTGTSDAAIQLVDQARDIDGFTYDRGFVGTSPMGTTMPSGTAPTQTTISPDGSLVISLYYNRDTYTITVTSGRGVVSVAATGWTNSGSATMSKDYLFGSTINLATNSTNVVTPTLKAGYINEAYTKTSGSGTLSNGVFTVGAGNATITVAATGITAPASVSISGGTTKTYNYQDTTLTVTPTAPSGGYDSGISYKYAYANTSTSSSSTCGTYGSYGSYGTSATTSVSKAAYRGYQCYKAKVIATDGTLISSEVETSNGTTMGLINRTITFDKNTGTLSGTSPLYAAYGDAKLYTSATNTTEGSVPSASKTGYTFKGWYTASSAGSQVYNASGVLQASVSGYTNGSAQWIATANKTLYAQFDINTYTIAYDLKGGDAPSGNDYIPVEYIASTSGGNQYIDTLYKLQTNNVIYNWTARDDSGSGTSLFGAQGSQDGGTRYTGILYGSKSSRSVYTGSSTGGAIGYVSSDSAYHDWELHAGEGTVSLTKDGTQLGSVAYNGNLYKGKNIVLFGNRTGTTGATQYMLGTFKHFSIIDNGTLAFNGIPVRQISTDKCGLYDTVSGTFFSSASGTEFDCPTESARPTSVEYNEIFGVIQPTRPHSTFTGWNLANMENGITHMKGDTASNLSSFGTGTTYNGTTETYYQNLRATNGTVTFTATWSCDVGYASNVAGTSCDAVNYPMQYTCSDNAEGYTYEGTAPTSQTAHYLADAPLSATLPGLGSCQKVYGQGTTDYCADCFNFLGWSVDAEEKALELVIPHAAGDTIPTWGKTGNTTWCKIAGVNDDWGSTSGACAGFTDSTPFTLRPVYEPKTYTLLYAHAPSTGLDTGNRPGTYVYTYGRDTISAADLSLAHGHFDGWCKDDPDMQNCTSGTRTFVGPRDFGPHTFYAKWACDAGYSLSYDANGDPICTAVSITCSAGYYLPSTGTSSADCTSCPAGKYCRGGTWTYDGTEKGIDGNVSAGYYAVGGCKVQNPSTSSDYITGGECAPCGSNWTSNAGAQAHTACYRNIVLNKNGMSGTLTLPSNSGCKSIGGVTGSTNDTLVVYYNTTCKLPTTVLTGTATGTTYTSTGSWATSANAASDFVTTIKTTSTSATITRYAGKTYTCAAGYYLAANTNGACSVCTAGNYCLGITNVYYSSSDQGLSACPTGYTFGGTGLSAQNQCKASCGAGQCLPTANGQCTNVGAGNWSAGGLVAYGSTLACNACASGLTTIGYGHGADEADDCGRILHVGENHVYLRSGEKTHPSLHVKIGNTVFYGNMSTTMTNMSDGINHKLKMKYNNATYSVYDDSARNGL